MPRVRDLIAHVQPRRFLRSEAGAVTADFMVITGLIISLALAVAGIVGAGAIQMTGAISSNLSGMDLSQNHAGSGGTGADDAADDASGDSGSDTGTGSGSGDAGPADDGNGGGGGANLGNPGNDKDVGKAGETPGKGAGNGKSGKKKGLFGGFHGQKDWGDGDKGKKD